MKYFKGAISETEIEDMPFWKLQKYSEAAVIINKEEEAAMKRS